MEPKWGARSLEAEEVVVESDREDGITGSGISHAGGEFESVKVIVGAGRQRDV